MLEYGRKKLYLARFPQLAFVMTSPLDLGKFPKEWKSAIVTPFYKNKVLKSSFNNYRGISVLPQSEKFLKKS